MEGGDWHLLDTLTESGAGFNVAQNSFNINCSKAHLPYYYPGAAAAAESGGHRDHHSAGPSCSLLPPSVQTNWPLHQVYGHQFFIHSIICLYCPFSDNCINRQARPAYRCNMDAEVKFHFIDVMKHVQFSPSS